MNSDEKIVLQERLMGLEMQFDQLEETIDALNQIVFRQQQKIDLLQEALSELAARVLEKTDRMNPLQERPPHY